MFSKNRRKTGNCCHPSPPPLLVEYDIMMMKGLLITLSSQEWLLLEINVLVSESLTISKFQKAQLYDHIRLYIKILMANSACYYVIQIIIKPKISISFYKHRLMKTKVLCRSRGWGRHENPLST